MSFEKEERVHFTEEIFGSQVYLNRTERERKAAFSFPGLGPVSRKSRHFSGAFRVT